MSNIWMASLGQLQRRSWDIGRPPLLSHWAQFFLSCRVKRETGLSDTEDFRVGEIKPVKTAGGADLCIISLPRELRASIAESLIDIARWSRLRQLLTSPGGILTNSRCHARISDERERGAEQSRADVTPSGCDEGRMPEVACGITPAELSGPTGAPNSTVEDVLVYWSASHETPLCNQELESWLRDTVELLHFFTLRTDYTAGQLPTVHASECLEYSSMLCVILRALCAMFLRPREDGKSGLAGLCRTGHFEREVALLSLWLLRSAYCCRALLFNRMLQVTQMLLATGESTREWLLHVPALLRCSEGGFKAPATENQRTAPLLSLVNAIDCSLICQITTEIVPLTPATSSPCLQSLFVDPHASADESTLRSLNEQLSCIALSSFKE
uniref:Uncharacterized protein n=1 Tax=Trypanosoma congolense (strain IL3000) TaxID=1068625 RepID=G0UPC1_TRYCI|nr:conserved hypothetical protein [Trypanosoma congolense IL3000]